MLLIKMVVCLIIKLIKMKKLTKISLGDKLKKLDELSNPNLAQLRGGNVDSTDNVPKGVMPINLPTIKPTIPLTITINPAGGTGTYKIRF